MLNFITYDSLDWLHKLKEEEKKIQLLDISLFVEQGKKKNIK